MLSKSRTSVRPDRSHNFGTGGRKDGARHGFLRYNPPAPKQGREFLRTQFVSGVLGVLAVLTPASATAQAIPDPTTDRELSAKLNVCNACHDVNGRRKTAIVPVIWGQQENYLMKQLRDFETKERVDEVMLWMVKTLTQQEQRAAATYFAKQAWPARAAAAASSSPPPGIAVCQGCH